MKDVIYTWIGEKKFDNEKFSIPGECIYEYLGANSYFTKPGRCFKNTLWGSPVDENKYYTWRRWSGNNLSRKNKFYKNFKLKEDANILTIDSYNSIYEFFKNYSTLDKMELKVIEKFCILCESFYNKKEFKKFGKNKREILDDIKIDILFNKDKIMKSWDEIYRKYDGMEVIHFDYNVVHAFFNTWDCDSICVWNKDKIILLEEGVL